MQHFKKYFKDINYKNTFSNVQTCLRLNDLNEIGDSTHYLTFDMLGFFSFREQSVENAINFWIKFLERIDVTLDYVTIHSDKFKEWKEFYPNIEVKIDSECKWTDGDIGGYCTEFYSNNVEIGNIVNTLGTCIDCGFGLERIAKITTPTKGQILKNAIQTLINSGITVSDYKHGYILKKLLTELVFTDEEFDHPFFVDIKNRQIKIYKKYQQMSKSNQYKDKSDEWWKSSIGIDLNNLEKYEKLFTKLIM